MIRPKRFINYSRFTLFMSYIAHEYKRLGFDCFIETYINNNYRGVYKKYLDGYIEYISNKDKNVKIVCNEYPNTLILEPYTYTLYFKYKDKSILEDTIKEAIPEFLKHGILITNIQEAVNA